MTERLYYEDVYLKEFDAVVLECTRDGELWKIIPDRSAFYPEGGIKRYANGTIIRALQ